MNEKRAFVVYGMEGSGTYMLWKFLQKAGCHAKPAHNGMMEKYDFHNCQSPYVIRRSYPHAGEIPDLEGITNELLEVNFDVEIVVMIREPNATYLSILNRNAVDESIWKANYINFLLSLPSHWNVVVITYEAFCLSEGFRRWFVQELGLNYPEDFVIEFGNEKYYE